MRARVIERASGAVVGEIEAETSYALWQALLNWGEQRGVPRFRVPERYRTERTAEAEAPPPTGVAGPPAPTDAPAVEAPRGPRGAARRSRRVAEAAAPVAPAPDPTALDSALPTDVVPPAPPAAAPAVVPEEPAAPACLPLEMDAPVRAPSAGGRKRRSPAASDGSPPAPRARAARHAPAASPPAEQLRLF